MAVIITLPDAVMHAINQLNNAGYEAFTVGGCVRDSLLGNPPDDWDITTSATPEELKTVFASYKTIETGLMHGTLTVLLDGTSLEITTYRVDGNYSDGRHPDSVTFSRNLTEDLCRRDFTINAMAYHPVHGLVDVYHGRHDLQAGIIRCVGDASRRFSEDALRILRALRFASVLGFSIDVDTDKALHALAETLPRISAERLTAELCKLLCGKNAASIVHNYLDVLGLIIPELKNSSDFTLLTEVPSTPLIRLTALFWDSNLTAESVQNILHRLRLDHSTIRGLKRLMASRNMPHESEIDLLYLLNALDSELIDIYLALSRVNEATRNTVKRLLDEKRCYKISMLQIDGTDIVAQGIAAGPAVGQMLNALLTAVIDGHCSNERAALLTHMNTLKEPVQ